MKRVIIVKAAILALIILSSACIPASAYSNDAVGWYEQGNALIKNKSYTDAVAAFDRALVIEPSYFEAWNGKADALNRAGQFTKALTASDKTIALKPDYVNGWINRGYILYNLGRYDEELRAYETAITLDPASPDAWFNKGYSLAGMKRYDEAIAAFNNVYALDPAYPNLAANIRIAEQNRNTIASPPGASERTLSTVAIQSQIKTVTTLPSGTVVPVILPTKTPPKKSPAFVGGITGIFSILVIARNIGKRKNCKFLILL